MKNNSITLIGMAGAGKSTVGKILAEKLGCKFVDIDELIFEIKKIPQYEFREKFGKEALTALETELTLGLDFENILLSPPGSIIYSPVAMEKIKQNSTVVYLETKPATIEQRMGEKLSEVMWFKEKGLVNLMSERALLYEKYADLTFCSGEQAPEEMAEIIFEKLKSMIY